MTFEETMKLVDRGFTADEIRALAKEKEEGGNSTDPVETPAETGDPAAEKTGNETADIKALNDTIQKLSETVSKMQEENIKNARTGSGDVHADPIKEKMDEFIKGL